MCVSLVDSRAGGGDQAGDSQQNAIVLFCRDERALSVCLLMTRAQVVTSRQVTSTVAARGARWHNSAIAKVEHAGSLIGLVIQAVTRLGLPS